MSDVIKKLLGYTEAEVYNFKLPQRIALQAELTQNNQHTEVLIVGAIVQQNRRVLTGLLVVHAFQLEYGYLNYELGHFRDWLGTLLVE